MRVLDRLDAPAIIISDLGVTLAQNPLARALLGDQMCYDGINRSICYRWFMHPDARRIHPPEDHVLHSRAHVGILRVAHGRAAKDPYVTEIIDRLLRESREFAELWERHEVGRGNLTRKRFVHPEIGTVTLDCQTLTAENQLERLLVFTAREGSEDERRLAALGRVL